ncbi:hypothetical protein KCP77_22990 [Salmonella enterica subsp. enterica]|nr:hypothetical protein KCP77_22990 [Salmonella enterica subsp. enterica]
MRKDAPVCFPDEPNGFFDPKMSVRVYRVRHLAQRFNMQRNTASHYLNQLVAQGVLLQKSIPVLLYFA